MKKFLTFKIIPFLFLFNGCATSGLINKINIGMNRDEVIQIIGNPLSISAQGNTEYLNYRFSETNDDAFRGLTSPYFVRIINGKVESFGRVGDFDSTKTPTLKIENDTRIQSNLDSEKSNTITIKLKELKQMKDDGILNSSEYEKMKLKILSDWKSNN